MVHELRVQSASKTTRNTVDLGLMLVVSKAEPLHNLHARLEAQEVSNVDSGIALGLFTKYS